MVVLVEGRGAALEVVVPRIEDGEDDNNLYSQSKVSYKERREELMIIKRIQKERERKVGAGF